MAGEGRSECRRTVVKRSISLMSINNTMIHFLGAIRRSVNERSDLLEGEFYMITEALEEQPRTMKACTCLFLLFFCVSGAFAASSPKTATQHLLYVANP